MSKEKETENEWANCTLPACPYPGHECGGCGFDKKELRRRHALPLLLDEGTGLRRKYVGRNGAEK